MAQVDDIPQKDYFKTSEVCQLTNTQPYILRFWESEFPQLAPERGRSGQPVYRRRDIDLVRRIKELLYDEEFTIEGARKRLEQELKGKPGKAGPVGEEPPSQARPKRPSPVAMEPPDAGSVERQRYEDAVEEITMLRLKLQEAEANLRRLEARVRRAEEVSDGQRRRIHAALVRLEKLLETVDEPA